MCHIQAPGWVLKLCSRKSGSNIPVLEMMFLLTQVSRSVKKHAMKLGRPVWSSLAKAKKKSGLNSFRSHNPKYRISYAKCTCLIFPKVWFSKLQGAATPSNKPLWYFDPTRPSSSIEASKSRRNSK